MNLPLLAALAASAASPGAQPAGALQALDFLVGHCWRGQLSTGETDTHCFEPVYGGKHVRDLHEVTGGKGSYGGETFYSAQGPGELAFHYFNSLGGVSSGMFRAGADGGQSTVETYRGPDGKQIAMTVTWRPVGKDAYEVVTASSEAPAMNRTVLYRRVDGPEISVETRAQKDGTTTLVHELVVPAPPEAVWEAIATAEGWKSWAVPLAWTDPADADVIETSYDPAARPGAPQTIRQRFLARIPGRMLAFKTIKAPAGFPDFDQFAHMLSVFELEPAGAGQTRVRLTGVGYPDTEAGRRLLGFFRDGNKMSLGQLRERFESGPVDWKEKRAAAAK